MYKDQSLEKYLFDLASKTPAPGGGSASALTASLATGLTSMVVRFTLGKTKYAKYNKELEIILDKSERLRQELLRLVDLDVVAYQSKNPRDALSVPFMVCRLCAEGIKLCPDLIKKGNINLISDVAVSAILFESAFVSASFNVEVNLKTINDKKLTQAIVKELTKNKKSIIGLRRNVEARVGKIIRG